MYSLVDCCRRGELGHLGASRAHGSPALGWRPPLRNQGENLQQLPPLQVSFLLAGPRVEGFKSVCSLQGHHKNKKVSPHFLQLGAIKLQNVKFTKSKLRWANTEILNGKDWLPRVHRGKDHRQPQQEASLPLAPQSSSTWRCGWVERDLHWAVGGLEGWRRGATACWDGGERSWRRLVKLG